MEKIPRDKLTQDILKEYLRYDPDTGLFTWLKTNSNVAKAGSIAGTKTLDGYISIRLLGTSYKAHKLAFFYMEGSFPDFYTDHINSNKVDNSWANIRRATPQQNNFNKRKYKNNKSGYKGVFFCKMRKKFVAFGRLEGKNYFLGAFELAKDASVAYIAWAKEQHGEFFRV